MSAQDYGTAADYMVNGDNYEKIEPDGSVKVIPGVYGKGPLSPTTDITPTVPNAFKQINPQCPGGHCEVWIHDRATGFYHIGPSADYNPAEIDCVCALVAGVSNPLNLSCRALLQQVVDSTAGQMIWGREVPWLLTELGIPIWTIFDPDLWFISCSTQAIVIPDLFPNPNPPPPPPPGPPPPPPPGPPPPPPSGGPCASDDPNADEILDFCAATQSNLQAILAAIVALGNPGTPGTIDPCCAAVIQAIGSVTAQLANITAILMASSGGAPPIDFSPLVAALGNLTSAVAADAPLLQSVVDSLNSGLPAIANAISSAPAADTKGIVDALNKANEQGDVDQFIFDALANQGFITPADLQVLQGLKWSDALSYIESTNVYRALQKTMRDIGANPEAVGGYLGGFAKGNPNPIIDFVTGALSVQRNFLQTILAGILTTVTSELKPPGATIVANIGVSPDKVLADVVAVGLNMLTLGGAVSLFREGAGEQIAHVSEVIAGVLGFEELKEVQIGPLVNFGIRRIAEMQAKKLFGQELPGATALARLAARGLITNPQYFTWVPYTGLPGELWEQERQAAYRGLNARQMLRLIETNLFSQAEINDELTFGGMRPVSQTRMLHAAPYLATNPQRSALRSTLEKAYIAGLMDDPTLTSNLDSIEQNVDRNNLVLQRAKWEVLIQESKDFESEYTTMFIGGLIDDPTFRTLLSGIGLQSWKVNTVAAKAEARSNATLQRKQLADALRLQHATATVERAAALKNYEQGTITLPLYIAALVATGLNATQATAWADLAALKKDGNVRWLYDMQLTPAEAEVKKQRETSLTDQRKRQLITQAQYIQGLTQLGISNRWINALDAAAEAMLTPKLDAFAVPVQTS